ncbi:HAE1 family hydrophobic/amphiphilic exporter-1 [Ancylomarina subtilis]|uniref:HAE1 family hydrophobic/amphiphilic exporter-1 n=1 Tax=Ancylomarina subtilis TaxID=1639035 RepID=A0A4Q7VAF2_9BACT|nr:efflux RND transporter permease subunit [Ancylomarina subtilis]RZT93555.1 HAE1 family hydrophobic/amphiphilic exporter-1 [Ancylomarina subtilis]
MFQKFIERPVLSTVISILIVILGILGLTSLPVQQFPEIAPPTVKISTSYPGANAETVLKSVVVPIEEAVNGVEGMTYMSSSSSNDGSATINVYFELGTDADIAAVKVQNRVATVNSKLPSQVIKNGLTTEKVQNGVLMFFSLYSENQDLDATFVENYARINMIPLIKRINGVGDAKVFGSRDYSMRIWLNPEKMAVYGLSPQDIANALNEQNIEAAPGKFGENSSQSFEYVIRYKGKFSEVSEYENIILRSEGNNNFLRLKDVAKVELGAFNYSITNKTAGNPSVAMAVYQTAGSNAQQIVKDIEKVLENSSKDFPAGIKYVIPFNTNEFLDASIHHVIMTLIEAFLLVFLVVFLFLQDFRSTLIPAIAVPVSIIGTFFCLQLFGFSINMLTLFALVLAIGIVVDDAIVVVEAVHAKLDAGAKSGKKATLSAMSEITGAIISITLVMAAVFVPVSFLEGPTGAFYQQFAITLAVAIVISAINALTLSPALCALLLKPHNPSEAHKKGLMSRFYTSFNTGFDAVTDRYTNSVRFLINRKWLSGLILVVFVVMAGWMFKTTQTGFIPNEDQGMIFCDITLPPGSTLDRTVEVTDKVDAIIKEMDVVDTRMFVNGFSLLSGTRGGSKAFAVIKLKPWDQRKEDHQKVKAVVGQLFGKTAGIAEARILFFTPPTVRGFGNSDGFEMQLQDKTNGSFNGLMANTNKFLMALNQRPEIKYAITSFNTGFPQYEMDVNVEKVKEAGISVNGLFATLQGYYGSWYAADFNRFGKQYRVMIQADPEDRATAESLNNIFIKNGKGELVAVSQFVQMTKVNGPDVVSRFNLFNSATINGNVNPGYSTGDAIQAVKEVAAEVLPASYGYEFSGMTREEQKAGNKAIIVFVLSLIFVYFLLSAQYESYILPFSILLSLPIGIFGSIFFINMVGLDNNIYFQVALIMLIGLLAKNAILIVEFALQRRREGMSIPMAAVEGAKARLRPILMTSFAFILGLMPLMLSTGAGAVGNRSIGTGAVGGMLIGTLFGVFVIPVFFVVFQHIQEKITGAPKLNDTEPKAVDCSKEHEMSQV